jgi:hypothetical protein
MPTRHENYVYPAGGRQRNTDLNQLKPIPRSTDGLPDYRHVKGKGTTYAIMTPIIPFSTILVLERIFMSCLQ